MPKIMEVAAGVVVGGAIAGVVLFAAGGAGQLSEDQTLLVQKRKGLQQDPALLDAVTEPEQLFRRVDPEKTEELLDALDGLAMLFRQAQTSGTPLLVAKALAHKRRGLAAIEALLSELRRRFPSRAADAAEDAEVLRKAMADYVHNIQQAGALALIEFAS